MEVVSIVVLDDVDGLIAFEIFVGEGKVLCGGRDMRFEFEDGDGIVLGDGCRGESNAFVVCADLEA